MDAVEAVAGAGTMEEIVDQVTEGIDKARTNKRVYAKLAKKPPRASRRSLPIGTRRDGPGVRGGRSPVGQDQGRGEDGGDPVEA